LKNSNLILIIYASVKDARYNGMNPKLIYIYSLACFSSVIRVVVYFLQLKIIRGKNISFEVTPQVTQIYSQRVSFHYAQ
jgi:hypothetical protein